jgi:hypothetical protein
VFVSYYVAVLRNSKFHIYKKKREEEKVNENQHDCHEATSSIIHIFYIYLFFIIPWCFTRSKLGRIKIVHGVIFVGTSWVISSFDIDLWDAYMKLVPLKISRLIHYYEHACFDWKLKLHLDLK